MRRWIGRWNEFEHGDTMSTTNLKLGTRLILNMAHAHKSASPLIRKYFADQQRAMGTRRYVRYLKSLHRGVSLQELSRI